MPSLRLKFIINPNQELAENEKQKLLNQFKPILLEAFNQRYYDLYWKLKEQDYFKPYTHFVLIYDNNNNLIGWVGIIWLPLNHKKPIIYIDIFKLLKKHQNQNIAAFVYRKFFEKYIFGKYFRFYLCARTQTPAVYKSLYRFSNECYPKLGFSSHSNEITQLSETITQYLWPDKKFDSKNMVVKDVWGFSIYNSLPYSKNRFSNFYKNHTVFDANKGDTLFILSYIDLLSWKFWKQLVMK